jgi:hypothetical protein
MAWNCVLFGTDGSSVHLLLLTQSILVPLRIVAATILDHKTGIPGEEPFA